MDFWASDRKTYYGFTPKEKWGCHHCGKEITNRGIKRAEYDYKAEEWFKHKLCLTCGIEDIDDTFKELERDFTSTFNSFERLKKKYKSYIALGNL